jgi:hypothetical protein
MGDVICGFEQRRMISSLIGMGQLVKRELVKKPGGLGAKLS